MRAISIWQPYTSLAVKGKKRVETRSWPTKIRGWVALHAAKRSAAAEILLLTEDERACFLHAIEPERLESLPAGAMLGQVYIAGCKPIEELYGSVYDTPQERVFGDWSPGRFGWILERPQAFSVPIPARGRQGFWNWQPPF